jgi:hypothetical protein
MSEKSKLECLSLQSLLKVKKAINLDLEMSHKKLSHYVPLLHKSGKYHCTIDLLFDWFELVCFANKSKTGQLSYSWFQTSQTGGQQYSDTSPFNIPCTNILWA